MDVNDDFSNNSSPEESCTPEELKNVARNVSLNLLPEKSKHKYEKRYELFTSWCESKNVKSPTENVLLAYFAENSKVMKSSTLWGVYSMLKSTIQIKHNINIGSYKKLIAFLKKTSVGYEPKKSKILSKDEVETFLKTAPDDIYLMKKVVLIFGIAGACRCDELTKLQVNNIEDKGSLLIVKIPDTKTNKSRTFIVTNDDGNGIDYLDIIRKYMKLRPPGLSTGRLFLKYCKGVCNKQNIGLNTIAKVPKDIATFLKLPDPLMYTGHCFRRTSATLLVEAGGDILQLKRHGGWKSSTVAEGYIDDSISGKVATGQLILGQSSTQATASVVHSSNKFQESSSSGIVISNCENCTFNINVTNQK